MSEPRTISEETVEVMCRKYRLNPSSLAASLPADFGEVTQRDPVWQVLVRCKGVVVGADEALDYYTEQLQRRWRERELLTELRLLGERSSEFVGPRGSKLTG